MIVLTSTTAHAQEHAGGDPTDEERARAHFAMGQEHAAAGRFEAAYAAFAAGHGAVPRSGFLFNMAECLRELERYEEARRLYERYLEEDPSGSTADVARRRLDELPRAPGVDPTMEAPSDPVAAPDRQALPPETTANVLLSRQRPTSDRVLAPGPAPDPSLPFWEDWPFWTAIGAAVVAGVVVTITLALTLSSGVSCDSRCEIVDLRTLP